MVISKLYSSPSIPSKYQEYMSEDEDEISTVKFDVDFPFFSLPGKLTPEGSSLPLTRSLTEQILKFSRKRES